jgi:RNA polymerase sigma-70 factor (ECF subfamily)
MKIEEALVIKAMSGDEYAINRLLNQSYSPAYRFALKYFGDHDTAMEVTQRCFIKVSERIQHLEDPKTYKSWLFRILTNQCHEEKRRAKSKGFLHWLSFTNKRVSTIEHAGLHNHLADSESEADQHMAAKERQQIL